MSKERDRKLLPHEAVKIPTCTKKISLTRAQTGELSATKEIYLQTIKNNFCYVES